MIFMSREELENLIDSRVAKAILAERERHAEKHKEPQYAIGRWSSTHFAPELKGRPFVGRVDSAYSFVPLTEPTNIQGLLNQILNCAGIELDVTPATPAQLKAVCKKQTKGARP
jgi:hypothetical protein